MEAGKTAADREAEIARLAANLDGKPMVLQGFIVGKTGESPVKIMIGKYAWDGKAKGTPPGLYNTVLVSPKSAGDTPPVWWQGAAFKGTIQVTKDPSERVKIGIVSLRDAVLAVAPESQPGALVDAGLLLPLTYEFMMLAACGGVFLLGLLSKRSNGGISPAPPGDKKRASA